MNAAATHPAPEEIMALFDHELSREQAKSVAAHSGDCQECFAVLANFASISHHLEHWPVSPIPRNLAVRIAENTKRAEVPKSNIFVRTSLWTSKQWTLGLSLGMATLLFVAALSIPNLYRSHSAAEKAALASRAMSVDHAHGSAVNPSLPMTPTVIDKTKQEASLQELQRAALSEQLENTASDRQTTIRRIPEPTDSALPQAPMIARSVSLSIIVKDFPASRIALDDILARHRAYAADLKASTVENSARSLTASLRVPANDLAATLAELKALGRVQEETQNGEEVSQQHADLVARLKNSRETEQRLQTILAQRTGKMSDVLEVEQEISRVRGEIEEMEAELKNLNRRVAFASINLTLNEEYQASISIPPLSARTRLRNAVVRGFRDARETLLGVLLLFAEYGLTLAIWLTIFALPVFWLWRRYRRSLASI